ncbi:hypothetical protein OZ410_09200 [Robiginitalea sp. M366]|uniref:hypothetical protein n=1 Tax=Robiginitalea aestuariiviva TaxID=3036903 RepID=UPI00240E1639|nr:hypothetical protein [Robiginitalea aestuariiviva]MDG1572491.1 hypothetical protein [Robiginitalea aestuariiviva]
MNTFFLTFVLTFSLSGVVAQKEDPLYLWRDYLYDDLYIVSTLQLHPDSTYTRKIWDFEDEKKWTAYTRMEPEVKTGRFQREGKYFILIENKDGNEVRLGGGFTLTKRMLTFYYPNPSGTYVEQGKYRRIH